MFGMMLSELVVGQELNKRTSNLNKSPVRVEKETSTVPINKMS